MKHHIHQAAAISAVTYAAAIVIALGGRGFIAVGVIGALAPVVMPAAVTLWLGILTIPSILETRHG